jgi:hypothetical protein
LWKWLMETDGLDVEVVMGIICDYAIDWDFR